MSNKEKILEMLMEKELTVKEIAEKLEISENAVNVYICRLRNDNLIKKVGIKNRYNIYASISKEIIKETHLDTQILKKLLVKFVDLEVKLENTNNNEDKRIMELIKECQLI